MKVKKAIPRTNRGVVLAEGEATGHAHATMEPSVELFELESTDDRRLTSKEAFPLTHEEHDTQVVEPPEFSYRIETVQEFDHFENEKRAVMD